MANSSGVVNTCVCRVCNGIRLRLNKIFIILHEYGWLLDTYIVDFFEDDVWIKLPAAWRDALGNASLEELGNWVTGTGSKKRVWPLSLLAFQKTIKSLEINRDYGNNGLIKCCGSLGSNYQHAQSESGVFSCRTKRKHLDQEHQKLFTKSVKKKKCHEIENIAKTTSECAYTANCECIIDVGAGMGHLARTLAYTYGLCVVCLEQDESLSRRAKICDERVFTELTKKIPRFSARNPRHLSIRLAESDVQSDKIVEKWRDEFTEYFGKSDAKACGFGLVGLHTCGDLAANLIRLYLEREETRFICIVGCCYMKITCGTKETSSFGYPLSKYVSTIEKHEFSYAALEVACHAIENYCDKLRTGERQYFLVHAYRATLETILVRKNGQCIRRSHLTNVKLKDDMTFECYCATAMEALKPENRPENEDLKTADVKKCLARWREVVAFGTLRFMFHDVKAIAHRDLRSIKHICFPSARECWENASGHIFGSQYINGGTINGVVAQPLCPLAPNFVN